MRKYAAQTIDAWGYRFEMSVEIKQLSPYQKWYLYFANSAHPLSLIFCQIRWVEYGWVSAIICLWWSPTKTKISDHVIYYISPECC